MEDKVDVLEDFYSLAEYLKKEGKKKNLKKYKKYFPAFLLHANHIKAYDFAAPFCKDKKVLDIGCFIGYGEKRISSQSEKVVAIDSDEKALAFARQKNKSILNVEFKKVDARRLPFPKESFDIIIAFQLIEHILKKQVKDFLSEAERVLKKEGLLLITTPNRKSRLLPLQKPLNPEHYQEFTARRLYKTLKSVFSQVQIKGMRAKKWIEEIERNRVRKTPYQVYIHDPSLRFLSVVTPTKIKRTLKSKKVKKISPKNKDRPQKENDEFNKLFQKFSMNDFFLEDKAIDKSLALFAICKK
jgi:2-polyprenyl-3-methyl-5-hydroxy-6-metoxy-1,4-benzoquinol methylase